MKKLVLLLILTVPVFGQFSSTNATKLRGINICPGTPTDTQVLTYSSANRCWQPGAGGGGAGEHLLPDATATITFTGTYPNRTIGVTPGAISFPTFVTGVSKNGSQVVLTGPWAKAGQVVTDNCTIVGWDIMGDQSGSIVIDVWKVNAANPTVANTITGGSPMTTSSVDHVFNGSVAGWNTTVVPGDVFIFNTNSATGYTEVQAKLKLSCTQ